MIEFEPTKEPLNYKELADALEKEARELEKGISHKIVKDASIIKSQEQDKDI